MTWSKLRLDIVILTFIIVSALTFGGQYAYSRLWVDEPAMRAMEAIPGVKAVQLERDAQGKRLVRIQLLAVPDFPETYRLIVATADKYLGKGLAGIVIKDGRDEQLVKTYNRMNLAVEEGIATGRFTQMASSLEKTAQEAGLDHFEVWVDEGHVYLALQEADHWLYEAVSRQGAVGASSYPVVSQDGADGDSPVGSGLPAVSIGGGGAS